MLVDAAQVGEIAPGGLKLVKSGESQVVLCNCDGEYYAVSRRCGHMNSPLEMGSLDGTILTCAMHHIQFDVTTGEALNRPIPQHFDAPLPDQMANYTNNMALLMRHVAACDIRTCPVEKAGTTIKVEIS